MLGKQNRAGFDALTCILGDLEFVRLSQFDKRLVLLKKVKQAIRLKPSLS